MMTKEEVWSAHDTFVNLLKEATEVGREFLRETLPVAELEGVRLYPRETSTDLVLFGVEYNYPERKCETFLPLALIFMDEERRLDYYKNLDVSKMTR